MGRTHHNTYKSAKEWEQQGLVGKSLQFTDDEIVSTLGIGKSKDMCRTSCAMDMALTYTLMSFGPDREVTAKECINEQTRRAFWYDTRLLAQAKTSQPDKTDTEYFQEKGKYPMVTRTGWHIRKTLWDGIESGATWKELDTNPLYRAKIISSWSSALHVRSWERTSHLTPLEDHMERGMNRVLMDKDGEKELLRCINKGFNRMVKNGRCIQTSVGRGRTFKWTQWNWLEQVRQEVLVSNSFNRKIGDTINGWEYAIKDTTNWWGCQVHTYHWKPVDVLEYYKVRIASGSVTNGQGKYYNGKWNYPKVYSDVFQDTPYVFGTKAQAEDYASLLDEQLIAPTTSYPVWREVDEDFNTTDKSLSAVAVAVDYPLRLKPDVFVEDLPTPKEILLEFLKSPAAKSNYMGMFDNLPKIPVNIVQVKKEEAEADA